MTRQSRKQKTEAIVAFIKQRCDIDGKVSFARVCLEQNLSPPALYGYIDLIQELEPDISFKNKEFIIHPKSWIQETQNDTNNREIINREREGI